MLSLPSSYSQEVRMEHSKCMQVIVSIYCFLRIILGHKEQLAVHAAVAQEEQKLAGIKFLENHDIRG